MPEIQKADSGARRKAIWLLIWVTLLGSMIIAWLSLSPEDRHPARWLVTEPWLLYVFWAVAILPLIAGGIWIWWIGTRCVAASRFPPPGMPVLRDTVVRKGPSGRAQGYVLEVFGLGLVALSIALGLMFYLMVQWMIHG